MIKDTPPDRLLFDDLEVVLKCTPAHLIQSGMVLKCILAHERVNLPPQSDPVMVAMKRQLKKGASVDRQAMYTM